MSPLTVETIVDTLHAEKDGKGWLARCVFPEKHEHGDANPSLIISEADGNPLVHCRGGCDQSAVFAEICKQVTGKTIEAESKEPFTADQVNVDLLQKRLAINLVVQQWMTAFGFTPKVVAQLQLGADEYIKFKKQGVSNALATPHYAHDGTTLIGLKYRAVPNKEFTQVNGSSIDGLFAAALVDACADYILVLEGDKDVAIAKSHGFNAVSILATTSKLSNADIDLLKRYPKIFLIGDQDTNGIEAMDKLEKRLPERQVIRVRLQVKDIGELYEKHQANFANQLWLILRHACVTRKHFGWDDLQTEDEIINSQGVKLEYAIDKLVPLRRITLLYGQEKSGKSLMALSWGKCVANGVKVFGKYATRKMPVLYLDAEHSVVGEYLSWIKPLGSEPIRFRTLETGVPALDDPALLKICAEIKPLLIVDSLHKFNPEGGNTWSSSVMEQIMAKLLALNALGATVILIHHAVRADVERYANSFAIGAAVDFMLAVVSAAKESDGTHRITLIGKSSRGAQPPTVKLIAFPFLKTTGQMALDGDAPKTDTELVYEFIEEHPDAVTQAIVKGVPVKAERVYTILKDGVNAGDLIVKDGKYPAKHYRLKSMNSRGGKSSNDEFAFSVGEVIGKSSVEIDVSG